MEAWHPKSYFWGGSFWDDVFFVFFFGDSESFKKCLAVQFLDHFGETFEHNGSLLVAFHRLNVPKSTKCDRSTLVNQP